MPVPVGREWHTDFRRAFAMPASQQQCPRGAEDQENGRLSFSPPQAPAPKVVFSFAQQIICLFNEPVILPAMPFPTPFPFPKPRTRYNPSQPSRLPVHTPTPRQRRPPCPMSAGPSAHQGARLQQTPAPSPPPSGGQSACELRSDGFQVRCPSTLCYRSAACAGPPAPTQPPLNSLSSILSHCDM